MHFKDYDCVVIGDELSFRTGLGNQGFLFDPNSFGNALSARKAKVPDPIDKYRDWIYIDCKFYPAGTDVESVLEKFADFTVSGVAIELRNTFSSDWTSHLHALPGAIEHITKKELHTLNLFPGNFHKILRLSSQGYSIASKKELSAALKEAKTLSEKKFTRETEKTAHYIGRPAEFLATAHKLGIDQNILDFSLLKDLKLHELRNPYGETGIN